MPSSNTSIINQGIQYNINDARNTIKQIKMYLICMTELLIKCLDNLVKLTSDSDNQNNFNNPHLDSVIVIVNSYVNELKQIVDNAQYNGRKLLADTYSSNKSIIFRLTNKVGCRKNINHIYNDFILNLPVVGINSLELETFESDFRNIFEL
jgi:flagellin-like hook-associated protein FlgL